MLLTRGFRHSFKEKQSLIIFLSLKYFVTMKTPTFPISSMDIARTATHSVTAIFKIIVKKYSSCFSHLYILNANDYICVTSFKRIFYHACHEK